MGIKLKISEPTRTELWVATLFAAFADAIFLVLGLWWQAAGMAVIAICLGFQTCRVAKRQPENSYSSGQS